MIKYKFKYIKGVDDLKSLYAFHGNSQGDTTQTNSIDTYNNSGGWLSFVFDCELTEDSIFREIEFRKYYNEQYIKKLKRLGEYGKEMYNTINLEYNEVFDNPNDLNINPLSSYQLLIL